MDTKTPKAYGPPAGTRRYNCNVDVYVLNRARARATMEDQNLSDVIRRFLSEYADGKPNETNH